VPTSKKNIDSEIQLTLQTACKYIGKCSKYLRIEMLANRSPVSAAMQFLAHGGNLSRSKHPPICQFTRQPACSPSPCIATALG
jgi:hypothetical protein